MMRMKRAKPILCAALLALIALPALAADDAGELKGSVLTTEGKPLAECEIICLAGLEDELKQATHRTRTDDAGVFTVPADKAACRMIVALKPGFGPGWLALEKKAARPAKQTLRIDVSREGSFKGKLVDQKQLPVANATLVARLDATDGKPAPNLAARVVTNEAGEFQLDGLAESPYRLSLSSETHVLAEEQTISVRAGEAVGPLTFAAVSVYSVSGQVLESGNDKPIAGVRVWVWLNGKSAVVKTDAQGRYSLRGLPPGWHVIQAGAIDQNYVSVEEGANESVGYPGTLQVLVRDKSLQKMNLRLVRGCELTGSLVDAAKKPKAKLEVYLNNDTPQLSRLVRRRKAVSDEEGRFRFRGLPTGRSYYCLIGYPDDGVTTAPAQFSSGRFNLSLKESPRRLNITVE